MTATKETFIEDLPTIVRAIRTRPNRFVLTADGQPDAWIASDLLVELRD